MRAGTVLAGMLIAAIAAFLVWFDATGQLRPFLSTAPIVVIELDPAAASPEPEIAETVPMPAETASTVTADATEEAADASSVEPDATADDTAADNATSDSGDTVDDAAPATLEAAGETASDLRSVAEAPTESASASDVASESDVGADAAADVAADIAADPALSDAATETVDGADDAAAEPESAAAADAASAIAASDAPGVGSSAPPPPKPAEASASDSIATESLAADAATPDAETTGTAAQPSGAELPWRRYAGEFSVADPRPRIAIVFTSLGLSDAAGDAIIAHMPPGVTLAFSPYSRKLTEWIERAREDGHEALIELPMEPLNYPEDDPGPLALLSTLPVQDNITRMDGILARADGVVGVAVHMGSRFTTSSELMRPILEALGERGYLYVDNGAAPFSVLPTLSQEIAVPIAMNDHYIDREASRIAIDGRLQQIERIA
ncbi:MAG: divergent polysaccharide deacetylase family protein, partial [Dongiaceae bacterium]